MCRTDEMEIYLQEYRSNRTELKRVKVNKEIASIVSGLKEKIDLLIDEKMEEQEKAPKKVKYLLFCRLLTSGYTQSYEMAIILADKSLYLNESMNYVFWKPEIIYDGLIQDMEEVTKLLKQKYIRLEQHELLYIERKLFLDDWELFCTILPDVVYEIAGNLVNSSLSLEDEIEVLYGGYMEEPVSICQIKIKERRENKWEVIKVHST